MAGLKLIVQQPSVEIPVTSKDGSGAGRTLIVGFKRYKTEEGAKRQKQYEDIVNTLDFNILDSEELNSFIKEEVLYMRKLSLDCEDAEGKAITIKVPDTRTAKKVETLWESPEECLDVLLDAYFQWSSWRVSFIAAVQSALVDMNFEGDARKN